MERWAAVMNEIELAGAQGPGPVERSWRARLSFRLFGHWPAAVVRERLAEDDRLMARLHHIQMTVDR